MPTPKAVAASCSPMSPHVRGSFVGWIVWLSRIGWGNLIRAVLVRIGGMSGKRTPKKWHRLNSFAHFKISIVELIGHKLTNRCHIASHPWRIPYECADPLHSPSLSSRTFHPGEYRMTNQAACDASKQWPAVITHLQQKKVTSSQITVTSFSASC